MALSVVVLGFGVAGAVFHAPLIAATPGLELAAVVTGDPLRRRAALERYPGVRVLPSLQQVWDDAGSYDLVVVATPNRTHVPLAGRAVEAGLAVVVDKPVAANSADARGLRDLAALRGVPVTVFHNRRWDADIRTLRLLLGESRLGTVHRFESRFERWRPEPRAGAWRELADPADAGGLLFDLGSHLVDQALQLFGPVRRVYAELDRRRPGAAVDDDAFVALTHADGTHSHLWASVLAADPGPRLRVRGSAAAYVLDGLDLQEAALRAGGDPGAAGWGEVPHEAWGRLITPEGARPVPSEPGAYQLFYAELVHALVDGGPLPVTVDEALAGLLVLEAARDSAVSGRTVEL